ncbi:MAG: tRNA (adenosine(37)-N6)-threonylcarbamoyltransferase complex ATPase subunit type 1 TsaE [Epsilonproteobacteria bacterium]|nr:tRNA (adenosine(37)-N6)-threonylcarbamoyltransferase complex ATPase subunit type 1 TsaE [Campylobacterota bacterium]
MNCIKKTVSLEKLDDFIEEIIKFSHTCRIFLLKGDLASGKTTFVQRFSKQIGLNENVTSPTFSKQQVYGDKLYHYDIYQDGVGGFIKQGLIEELDKDGYHMIEWADEKLAQILDNYFYDYMTIEILKIDEKKRVYKVSKCIH